MATTTNTVSSGGSGLSSAPEDANSNPMHFAEAKIKLLKLTPQEVFFAMIELSEADRANVNALIQQITNAMHNEEVEAARRAEYERKKAIVEKENARQLARMAAHTPTTPHTPNESVNIPSWDKRRLLTKTQTALYAELATMINAGGRDAKS